jgi:hypothetical protein
MPDCPWPNRLVVGVLTGGRPQLLQRTLAQFFEQVPRDRVELHVLINGDDADSNAIAEQYVQRLPLRGCVSWFNLITGVMPIGEAVSYLIRDLPDDGYYLHLEDDWSSREDVVRHICAAAWILDYSLTIGHVKLRHFNDEKTNLSRQGCAIKWEDYGWYWASTNASFTFNPALTRMDVVKRIFACRGEYDAQEKYEELGLGIAQLIPGCFIHTDDGDSLRKRLNRGHRDDLPF